jgi:hypothetical protein
MPGRGSKTPPETRFRSSPHQNTTSAHERDAAGARAPLHEPADASNTSSRCARRSAATSHERAPAADATGHTSLLHAMLQRFEMPHVEA